MKKIVFFLVALGCQPLLGQELQVYLDREGTLDVLDRKLERQLRLFPDIIGFREARLFQLPDSSFALEIFYRQQGHLFKQRQLLTKTATRTLQKRVSDRILALRPRALQDLSGRPRFLVRSFLLSYGFYSWATPIALGLDGRPSP